MQFKNSTQAKYHIARTTKITKTNMEALNAQQIKDLANEGMVLLTLDQIEAIFAERNEIAANNSRLALENSRLRDNIETGKMLYRNIKKSLNEMTDEELSNLGYVRKERAAELIKQAMNEGKTEVRRARRIAREVVKHG